LQGFAIRVCRPAIVSHLGWIFYGLLN